MLSLSLALHSCLRSKKIRFGVSPFYCMGWRSEMMTVSWVDVVITSHQSLKLPRMCSIHVVWLFCVVITIIFTESVCGRKRFEEKRRVTKFHHRPNYYDNGYRLLVYTFDCFVYFRWPLSFLSVLFGVRWCVIFKLNFFRSPFIAACAVWNFIQQKIRVDFNVLFFFIQSLISIQKSCRIKTRFDILLSIPSTQTLLMSILYFILSPKKHTHTHIHTHTSLLISTWICIKANKIELLLEVFHTSLVLK